MYIGLPNLGLNGVGGGLKPGLNLNFTSTEIPDSRLTFSGGAGGTRFNSAGTLVSTSAPRYDYNPSTLAARGLLIEKQRTNSIRNNSMTGTVVGTPGTVPTNWILGLSGVSQQVVGFGTSAGIPYVDIRFFGTTSSSGGLIAQFDTTIAATTGQFWAASAYVALVGGDFTNITTVRIRQQEYNAGFLQIDQGADFKASVTASLQRFTFVNTIANVGTTFSRPEVCLSASSGVAVDVTIRIGAPQMEQLPDVNSVASSPVLTTTVAVTRTEDIISITGSNFSSWYNQVNGTFVTKFDSFAPTAAGFARVFEVDDGTGANVLGILANNGAGTYFANSTVASVGQVSLFTGAVTANVARTEAFAYAAANFGFSDNGGAAQSSGAGTLPTVDRLFIGNQVGGNAALNGHIQYLKYYSSRIPNATLPTL